ncbi:hypothetical protein [Amycolatopsis sp. NPDC098790]|uniref:hypothetical protein n=1 Tax=Amycolatopsis sp. NPDC098790 TaxID=3363939 RepID=UPI003802B24B
MAAAARRLFQGVVAEAGHRLGVAGAQAAKEAAALAAIAEGRYDLSWVASRERLMMGE